MLERRDFLKLLALVGADLGVRSSLGATTRAAREAGHAPGKPGRIPNEYSLLLPGEQEALAEVPAISGVRNGQLTATLRSSHSVLRPGDALAGWRLLTVAEINGVDTAVFEKHVTHRGTIVYVTEQRGAIAVVPKYIGDLSKIRPRPIDASGGVKLTRPAHYVPGPDVCGDYLLKSSEDPCYENVAALGAEYIGWALVANEQGGPEVCMYLDAAGTSREIAGLRKGNGSWEPDQLGAYFDPTALLPGGNPQIYEYQRGWSKRTLLGGFLPVADIGVWNAEYRCGYEAMLLLPPGVDAKPIGRVRSIVPGDQAAQYSHQDRFYKSADGTLFLDQYWNCTPQSFYSELAGIWNQWSFLYETSMPVKIPDEWLLDAARAGITLCRCSYRGLEPTYQVGEGAYTKIPERSHALFPVAEYEFVWAQQIWNLTKESDTYFQYYLDKYILPNGNFVYNTQDQVEAPLNAGIFLANSARSYDYTRNLQALKKRLPILDRMIAFVLERYEYSKRTYPHSDRRYGLIYGSPEADLGDPHNDFPNSHPLYYQNSTWIWRGLKEHARCLRRAALDSHDAALGAAAGRYAAIADEMRGNIQASLKATLALRDTGMKSSGITPFTPDDIHRQPQDLSSYENHRFMQDWFLADWGDEALDLGHLRHRELAGMQILGLATDGAEARTSNFMDHGSLAVKIRQQDYRPFLLDLYALVCYAADSGNRYSPEDALIPGGFAGEGNRYAWSAVINSTLQPALGLRWLLCYEEWDQDICHIQKAAPKHWFASGQEISVRQCPTRFGTLSWSTRALSNHRWKVQIECPSGFSGDIMLHIHPEDRGPIQTASAGQVSGSSVLLPRAMFATQSNFEIDVS